MSRKSKPKISVILTEEELEKLKRYADDESRPAANLAAFIIREWLKTKPD